MKDESKQENINSDNELNSESITPDDNTIRRKSIVSGRFTDDKENISTPAINDTSTNNTIQPPVRSMSESALIDSTEQPSNLPIQQDASSTDGDDLYSIQSKPNNTVNNNNEESTDQLPQDSLSQRQENNTNSSLNDDFFNSKTRTVDDNQRPSSTKNQNRLDESTPFGTTSPKPSASRKQSVCVNLFQFKYIFVFSHQHLAMKNEANYLMKLVLILIEIIEK